MSARQKRIRGKGVYKRAVSVLALLSMLICVVPTNVFAILGAEQKLTGNQVTAGKESTLYYMQNDYIRFDIEVGKGKSDPIRMTTQPTKNKKSMSDQINKGIYQEVYFTVAGERIKNVDRSVTTVTSDTNQDSFKIDAIEATYKFEKDSKKYKAVVQYTLVQLDSGVENGSSAQYHLGGVEDDNGRTWGVRAVASIGYENSPSYMYSETEVAMWVSMHGFSKMGHPDATEAASLYMNTATGSIDDGFTNTLSVLPSAVSSVKTNVSTFAKRGATSSEAITEVKAAGYSWANPFAATSGLYREYVEGYEYDDSFYDGVGRTAGDLPCEFSTTDNGDLVLKCDYASLMGAERPRYGTSALWGFRDLYTDNDTNFTPSDNVSVATNAKHMGIYKDGNGFKAVPAANESELNSNTKKYGTPVAKIRGNFTEKNDRYYYTGGVAALSSTVTAVWSTSRGEFSIGKDGSISAKYISLNCPTFKFYKESDDALANALTLEVTKDGIEVTINPNVNKAKIALDIPNSSAELTSAVIFADGKVNFGGNMEFELFSGAEFDIEELSYAMKNGKFKMNGVHASGEIDTAEMLGLEMASISGEIDTINKYYHFELELNVFDLFETEAELELKRHEATGAILPNKLWFYAGGEAVKIPLVPPVVLANITGAGGGFDGLADTINGDFFAIPPIRFSLKGSGEVLGVVEGSVKYTLGPAYYKVEAEDIEFMDVVNLIDEFSFYESITGETKTYKNVKYTGLMASGGMSVGVSAPGGDWSFIEAGGELEASAFAGLDSYKNPSKIYIVADLNGKIYGKLKVPDKMPVIGGLSLLKKNLDMYLGASTQMNVSGGFDNAIKSGFKNFKVYGGVKYESDWKIFKYRVWYIFPENDLNGEVKPGWESLSEWNWSDRIPAGYAIARADNGDVALVGLSLEDVPYSVEEVYFDGGANTSSYTYTAKLEADNGQSLDSDATVMLMVTPKNHNTDIDVFAQNLSVKKGDTNIALTYPQYNSDNEVTNDSDVNAMVTQNADGYDCVIIGLGENVSIGDEWEVTAAYDFGTSLNASLPFDSVEAELNSDGDAVVEIKNPDEDADYVVATYLGTEKGACDYLVGYTEVTDSSQITAAVPNEGAGLPSGNYYVTVKLLREEVMGGSESTVANDDLNLLSEGQTAQMVYLPVDTVALNGTVSYTNSVQPQAPQNVSIAPTGNEVMSATWKENDTAPDGYRIKVYQKGDDGKFVDTQMGYAYDTSDIKAGKISGISYDSDTKTYSMDMALTVGGSDVEVSAGGSTTKTDNTSVLEANKEYKIGVSAYNYVKDENSEPISNSQVYSDEAESNASNLPEYTPVSIKEISVTDVVPNTTSKAVFDGENGVWNCSASANHPKTGFSETWRVQVDTADEEGVQCKVVNTSNGNSLTEKWYDYYCYEMNFSDIEGSVMLRIDIEKDHGTYKDVTTQYLIIEKDDVAPIISADKSVVYADPETGKYKIEGLSEAGATICVGGVNPADVTADENGRFVYEDNAFKMQEQKYDDEAGGYVYENGEPVYETVDNPDPGGLISVYAKDSVGNTSESITVVLAIGDEPEEDGSADDSTVGKSNGSGGGSVSYIVKYETNGGSKISNSSVSKNEKLTRPNDPTKDGYVFDGWYIDESLTEAYDFGEKVTKGFTLYAKWTEMTDEWTNPFNDVFEDDWFFENVKFVSENGLMKGLTDDEFGPNESMTRAMLVTVLYRAEGEPTISDADVTSIFADVDENEYYADAVLWAAQNGIVNGISDTEFAPNESVTREQIATIVYRYAIYKGYVTPYAASIGLLYEDVDEISDYSVEAVAYCGMYDIMHGNDDNTFAPKNYATRAEVTAILNRMISNNK